MGKFLDQAGLTYFFSKIKSYVSGQGFLKATDIANKADKSTTLSGYGITNAYTKTEVTNLLNNKAAKATTLSGYGITDAYTKTEVTNLLNNKAAKSTTLAGYGITNAYTKTEVDSKLSGKSTMKMYTGTGVPSSSIGANGDIYVKTK